MVQEKYAQRVFSKYSDAEIYSENKFTKLSHDDSYVTWDLFDPKSRVDFSYLKVGEVNFDQIIDHYCSHSQRKVFSRVKAYIDSSFLVGQDLDYNNLHDIIPKFLLQEYLHALNELSKRIWHDVEISPEKYKTLKNNHLVSLLCSTHRVNYNREWIVQNMHFSKLRNFLKTRKSRTIKYKVFGTKTGRFSTSENSFPILNLSKDMRALIKPRNDLFAVFDFNAAEIRTLLSLSGIEQPQGDLHEWNRKNIYKNSISRDESKQKFFAWLYNHNSDDSLDAFYDRKKVIEKYWNGTSINTDFGREIKTDERLALNYILQSTTNDAIMESLVKSYFNLKNFKGNLAFVIHDSVVLDCKREDASLLERFKENLEETRLGKFPCSFHIGKDFAKLRKIS